METIPQDDDASAAVHVPRLQVQVHILHDAYTASLHAVGRGFANAQWSDQGDLLVVTGPLMAHSQK
jgi:hypothetical protein